MTNPYNMGNYSQNGYYNQGYPQVQSSKSGHSTMFLMGAGAAVGGTVGYFKGKSPVSKLGQVSDMFAKEVVQNFVKKGLNSGDKKYFEQLNNVLNKIDKIKTPEKFKKLLNENKLVSESISKGILKENILNTVNSANLANKKSALKKNFGGSNGIQCQQHERYN